MSTEKLTVYCTICGTLLVSYFSKGGTWNEEKQDFDITDDIEQIACPNCDVSS